MWTVWALSACAWAAGGLPEAEADGARAAAVITVEQRPTLPILLMTPPGFDSALRGSDVIDAAARVLDRVSGVEGLSPEQAGLALDALDRCTVADRFACAVRLLRDLPRASRTSGWALLVLLRPSAGGDERLDLQILDIDAASRALAHAAPGEEAEDEIFRHVRALPPVQRGAARDAAALAVTFDAAVAAALGELLPPIDRGELALRVGCAPCDVALDGRWLVRVDGPQLTLRQVPVGERHLTLSRDGEARDYPVTVEAGARTEIDARDFGVGGPTVVPRGALIGGGAAAMVAGGVLIAVARASSSGLVCLEQAVGRCPSLGPWVRVDGDPLVATTAWDPLLLSGAGLAGAGLAWGGAGLLGDGLEPLWSALVAAAGAGVGVAIAAAGSAP